MKKLQKEKMKSMLNYYEIDMAGTRNEKMTTEQRKTFLDKFNRYYDSEVIKDIIKRISDNMKNNKEQDNEDKSDMGNDVDDFDLFSEDLFPEDNTENKQTGSGKKIPNVDDDIQYMKEINTFLGWLHGVLIQSRYNVVITDDNNTTNIQLIRLKKGGKKK